MNKAMIVTSIPPSSYLFNVRADMVFKINKMPKKLSGKIKAESARMNVVFIVRNVKNE